MSQLGTPNNLFMKGKTCKNPSQRWSLHNPHPISCINPRPCFSLARVEPRVVRSSAHEAVDPKAEISNVHFGGICIRKTNFPPFGLKRATIASIVIFHLRNSRGKMQGFSIIISLQHTSSSILELMTFPQQMWHMMLDIQKLSSVSGKHPTSV